MTSYADMEPQEENMTDDQDRSGLITEATILSSRFAHDASHISGRIENFAKWLASLQGKLPVSIEFRHGKALRRLSFDRRPKWELWYWRRHDSSLPLGIAKGEFIEGLWVGRNLSDCSIDDKIAAVTHFRALIEKLIQEQRSRFANMKVAGDELNALAIEIVQLQSKEGE